MRPYRVLLTVCILLLIPSCLPATEAAHTVRASPLVLAVADFSGADRELGRFFAETLLTNLAQSTQLQLVERSEIRQALTEMKLQSTGLTEPQQVKRLGKLVNADRLIVGSYLDRDNQLILNARLLDIHTGRLAPGGAVTVVGPHRDLVSLTQRLARQFHRRVTGQDLRPVDADSPDHAAGDDSGVRADDAPPDEGRRDGAAGMDRDADPSRRRTVASSAPTGTDADLLTPYQRAGLIPAGVRPNAALTERDLIRLVERLRPRIEPQDEAPVTATRADAPVQRLRALAALVKLQMPAEQLRPRGDVTRDALPQDADRAPAWGIPFLAAAIEQNWWPADRPFRPLEPATWTFVAALLANMPVAESAPPPIDTRRRPDRTEAPVTADAYTGLLVDARDLSLQRAMGPRVLDEDGRLVYPVDGRIPDEGFLQDHGMAAYYTHAQDADRAGSRPLIVRALAVGGPGHDDVVVSNETADRIRDANRQGRFLRRWAVGILIDRR